MKYRISFLIASMLLGIASAFAANGDTFIIRGIKFKILDENQGSIAITGSDNSVGYNVDLPNEVEDRGRVYSVVAVLGEKGITGTSSGFSNKIYSISVPSSVKQIGEKAFAGLKNLKEVELAKGVEEIGTEAFAGCVSLNSIYLPNSLKTIGESAFAESGVQFINVPASTKAIGREAFAKCTQLSSVTIDGETSMADKIFYQCPVLTNVNLSDEIQRIPRSAFEGCAGLRELRFPESLEIIDEKAFVGSGITKITTPGSLRDIKERAFEGCTGLVNITFNPGIEKIGECAFAKTSITDLVFPGTIRVISNKAFESCKGLAIVTFDGGCRGLGNDVFSDCKSLAVINKPDIFPANKFYNHKRLTFNRVKDIPRQNDSDPQFNSPSQAEVLANTPAIPAPGARSNSLPQKSDVDINIAKTKKSNDNTFALVIANYNYGTNAPAVDYAYNDGAIFAEYCKSTLGIPEDQITFVENATIGKLQDEINMLKNLPKYWKEPKIIVYYAGHAVTSEKTKIASLLGVDNNPSQEDTGYSFADLYSTLGNIGAKSVTVFLDACFSGDNRDGKYLTASRGIRKDTNLGKPSGNCVIFTACEAGQTAHAYNPQQHGLLTYFLLKKLQESEGSATLGELSEYLKTKVSQTSYKSNRREQTPSVIPSPTFKGWETLRLND